MPYGVINAITQTLKQDGTRIGDINKVQSYNVSNVASGPYMCGDKLIYNGRVSSIVLIGIDVQNGITTPQIIDIDATKFLNIVRNNDRIDTGSVFMSATYGSPYIIGDTIAEKDISMSGAALRMRAMQLTTAELATLNAGSILSYGATMTRTNKSKTYTTSLRAGELTYAGNSDTIRSAQYATFGMHELTHLFYTIDIIDELQTRYGYHIPVPTDPYSVYNWVRVSDYASVGADGVYYKVLILPEFDAYAHAGMIASPDILKPEFVATPLFKAMFKAMASNEYNLTDATRSSSDPTYDASNSSSIIYNNLYHCTKLKSDQMLMAGQYIYSKDFQYKLHLRNGGELRIWKLPINVAGLNESVVSVFIPLATYTRGFDNHTGLFAKMDSSGLMSIYHKPPISNTITLFGKLDNFPSSQPFTSTNISAIVSAGGAFVIAGNNALESTNLIYESKSNSNNWKYSTTGPLDTDCINNWSYRLNGTITEANIYADTQNNDTKKWCYTSNLVKPKTISDNSITYNDSNFQFILYEKGMNLLPSKPYDIIYNIINGAFGQKVKAMTDAITKDFTNSLTMGYCMRGDRLKNDQACLSSINELLLDLNNRKLMKYKADNQLCLTDSDKTNAFCMIYATPKDLSSSACKTSPEECSQLAIDYINNDKIFDATSNTLCDIAVSGKTMEADGSSYYRSTTVKTIKDACYNSYKKSPLVQTSCSIGNNRYRDTFTERWGNRTNQIRFNRKESYSVSCLTECDTAAVGTPLYNACKTGAIEYCSIGENYLTNECIKDKTKYPEIDTLITKWCSNNTNNASYNKYCPAIISDTATGIGTARPTLLAPDVLRSDTTASIGGTTGSTGTTGTTGATGSTGTTGATGSTGSTDTDSNWIYWVLGGLGILVVFIALIFIAYLRQRSSMANMNNATMNTSYNTVMQSRSNNGAYGLQPSYQQASYGPQQPQQSYQSYGPQQSYQSYGPQSPQQSYQSYQSYQPQPFYQQQSYGPQ